MTAEIAVGNTGYTYEQIRRANVNDKTNQMVDISDVILIARSAGQRLFRQSCSSCNWL